jgi:hypothetical protein
MSWAFKQDVEPGPKLVLLALADHANGQTGLCIPGQKLLADQCSMSVRTVQRHIQVLEDAGLLRREARMRGQGRGRTSDRYHLGDQGDNPAPTRQVGTTNATNQDDQYDTVGVAEPEENRKKNHSKRQSSMTDDWQPDPTNWEGIVARHKGIDHAVELANFRDHYISKAEKRADWNASLRTWMRNADKWKKVNPADRPANPTRLVGPNGYTFCQDCNTPWDKHFDDACIMMQEAMNG